MFQLQISTCSEQDIDKINEILESENALAITYLDPEDQPILEPDIGTTPLWPNVIIEALFANDEQIKDVEKLLQRNFPSLICTSEKIIEQDWVKVSINDFHPQQYGNKLWIYPSWLKAPDPKGINLILDPGLAFGTGNHPTTQLSLQWLSQQNLINHTLIDYGCGSGILGLSALKLGASKVYAVDIDPQALLATHSNAINNFISEDQIYICEPQDLNCKTHFLIANILYNPLLQLKNNFHNLLTKDGVLALSGILKEQADSLISNYTTHFIHQESFFKEDWSLIIFQMI